MRWRCRSPARLSRSRLRTRRMGRTRPIRSRVCTTTRIIGAWVRSTIWATAARGFVTDTLIDQVSLAQPVDGHETAASNFLVSWSEVADSVGIDSYAVEASKTSVFTSIVFSDTVWGALTSDTVTGL